MCWEQQQELLLLLLLLLLMLMLLLGAERAKHSAMAWWPAVRFCRRIVPRSGSSAERPGIERAEAMAEANIRERERERERETEAEI